MLRYFLVQKLYPLLHVLAQLYFWVLNCVFSLFYMFKPQSVVPWTDDDSDLLFLSAKKAAEKIRHKEISSEQLVAAYIARIRRVQPLINAIVADCFAEALEQARNVDRYLASLDVNSEEYAKLSETKPLLGVPFTNKNNMDAKGFVTMAGHEKYKHNAPATKDASVVERLRNAGAILLALTNLPRLAMNWTCENRLHGRTCNPYDLRRIPGGSSGGEAALIAAGGSIFGLGNDLGGSVRIPSFMCGIFGLKPTKYDVPLDGFVPPIDTEAGKAQWSIGPMCRYAEDLPIVYAIIAGKPLESRLLEPSIDFCQVRVLYMDQLNIWFVEQVHSEMRQALKRSVRHFETEFNVTAQKVDFPLAHHFFEIWGALGFGSPTKNLPEIISELPKLLQGTSDQTCCAWFFDFLHAFVETRNEQEKEFMLQKLEKLRHQLNKAIGDQGILLLPAWPTLAPFHWQDMLTPFNLAVCQLLNVLGFPSIACPVGLDSAAGVPLGIQIVGPPHSEPLLMAAARELERGFGGWHRP